jgi:hypothetical protein
MIKRLVSFTFPVMLIVLTIYVCSLLPKSLS